VYTKIEKTVLREICADSSQLWNKFKKPSYDFIIDRKNFKVTTKLAKKNTKIIFNNNFSNIYSTVYEASSTIPAINSQH